MNDDVKPSETKDETAVSRREFGALDAERAWGKLVALYKTALA